MNRNPIRRAFTLVELLAVLVLMGMLSAMVITATNGVIESAKKARTKKIIAAIDGVIQEKYRSYKYRPLPVEIPQTFNQANFGTTPSGGLPEVGFEVSATEAARVRLMMIRDLQRMELPDRLSDIRWAPSLLRAAANPVAIDPGQGDIVIGTRTNKNQRMFPVSWYSSSAFYGATFADEVDNVPAKLAAYRQRIGDIDSLYGFSFTSPAAVQNQGAECLYLIMATSYVGTGPAIDVIPAANIDDTDGDGLLEILDGWGQPLEFIRWPVGVADVEQSVIISAAPTSANPNLTPVPDDFDLLRAATLITRKMRLTGDRRSRSTSIVRSAPRLRPNLKPWSMRPLISSRGPNGASGIATNPWTSGGMERPAFSYRTSPAIPAPNPAPANPWNWPVDTSPGLAGPYYGTEDPGRDQGATGSFSDHPYIDPYMRRFVAAFGGDSFSGRLPGQLLSGTFATEEAADNITNYQLQSTPR